MTEKEQDLTIVMLTVLMAKVDKMEGILRGLLIAMTGVFITLLGIAVVLWVR